MSLGRRAYDLLRAYVGREWERIEGVFEKDARSELDQFLKSGEPVQRPASSQPPTVEPTVPAAQGKMSFESARRVLDLEADATLDDLKRNYKRLSERSLPTNFPEGSEERKKAAQVHLRVQEAYDLLLPILDERLKRFQSLDLS